MQPVHCILTCSLYWYSYPIHSFTETCVLVVWSKLLSHIWSLKIRSKLNIWQNFDNCEILSNSLVFATVRIYCHLVRICQYWSILVKQNEFFLQFSSKLTSKGIWLDILWYKSIQISNDFQNKSWEGDDICRFTDFLTGS